jgi:hypothetical protein
LNNFNTATNGDFGDWAASAGNDSFLAFSPSDVVNAVSLTDLREMDVIGCEWETAPVVTALTATVGEDGPTLSQNLLTGASDAENDALFIQNLASSVTTVSASTLAQTLFLGSDYTLSGSTISLTPAGFAKFNGLSAGETDTATFNYDVSDGITTTHNTFTLTINGANDAPSAIAIADSVSEDGPAVTLTASFTDPDRDDTHSFSINTAGTKGNVKQQ